MIQNQEITIQYIRERRCESGGYCFYRLDEPNAGDTFHALTSLAMLGALPEDDKATLSYLHTFQHPDGSFSNVNVGHAVIRSPNLLGARPEIDPSGFILSSLKPPGDTLRPVESSSLFEHVYLLADLCTVPGIAIPADKKTGIIQAVLRYRHPDTGFGFPRSAIIETAQALTGVPLPDANDCIYMQVAPALGGTGRIIHGKGK